MLLRKKNIESVKKSDRREIGKGVRNVNLYGVEDM